MQNWNSDPLMDAKKLQNIEVLGSGHVILFSYFLFHNATEKGHVFCTTAQNTVGRVQQSV